MLTIKTVSFPVFAVLLAAMATAPGHAELVTQSFPDTITPIDNRFGGVPTGIEVGQPFTLSHTCESTSHMKLRYCRRTVSTVTRSQRSTSRSANTLSALRLRMLE